MTGPIPSHFALLVCFVFLAGNTLAIAVAGLRLKVRSKARFGRPGSPPVSIVRPLCGVEPFSEECLRSGFELDHPEYELLFCVASPADPVVPVVKRLIAAYPGIDARLLVGDHDVSANPKLNNCLKGWNAARHEWVVLADSNVLMPANYVARLLEAWRPQTGVVCSTPIGSRPVGFASEVECAFLNTLQARWQYAAEAVGLGFAQGKSMLWRKSSLGAHGGLRALAAEIAEDAAATKLVRSEGRRVHLVDAPFEQPLGRRSFAAVWMRQLRWARLRRVTFPLFFSPEILTSAMIPTAAAGLAGWSSGGWAVAILAAVAMMVLTYGAELLLARMQGWHVSWRMPLACLARDLMIVPLWACAWTVDDVVWRGNAMTIRTRRAETELVENSV